MASSPTDALRADARRNRDAVVAAAIRVLTADPGASMQAIADASGVGRSTVYRRFPSRESLVAELLGQVLSEAGDGLTAAEQHPGPALEALDGLAAHVVGLGARYAFLGVHPTAMAEFSALEADLTARTAALVARWQAAGELAPGLPPSWPGAVLRGLSISAAGELEAGRLELADAVALVQRAVRAIAAP